MINLSHMRKILEGASAVTDYSEDVLQQQIADVNMSAVKDQVDMIARRALVLSHAVEVMELGTHPHPVQAFVHAAKCEGPLSDEDFFRTLETWAHICGYRPPERVIIDPASNDIGSSLRRDFEKNLGK